MTPGSLDAAGPIVVVEDVWAPAFDALAAEVPVWFLPTAWSKPAKMDELAPVAWALVVRNRAQITREYLVRCPRLEVVARAGVGLDNIDVAAADECGIVVIGAQGANARSVAELAVALALGLARDLVGHDRRVRAGGWDRRPGVELAGRTWGVVGLGSTGAATAGLASALGMMVIGCDAYLPRGEEPDCVERVAELGTLLARSDVVSLHLPHTAETAGIVDADFLARMRTGSFLVNVGRGGLIDEDALLDALDHGPLAGAALDVRASEPPTPGRLEGHERVVLTPHVAGLTYEAQERVVSALADDLRRALGGEEVEGGVGVCRRVGRRDGA